MLSHKTITIISLSVILLVIGSWFTILELDTPFFFSDYDGVNYYLPFYTYNWRAVVEQKTIPLINYHQFLGHPYLSMGQTGVLYPFAYLAVGLSKLISRDVFYTLDILAAIHLFIAVLAMFFLLKQLKIPRTISLLGAIMWSTYPYYIIMGTVWPLEINLLAYLPINFLLLEKFISRPRMKYAILLAAVKVWFFFGSYPEHVFMIMLFELLTIIFLFIRKMNHGGIKKTVDLVIPYLASVIILLLMSAPLFLPMYEAKILSAHRSQPVPFAQFMGFPLVFKTFVNAQLFTYFPKTMWWASSSIYHVGIFNIAILILFIAIRRIRQSSKPHKVLFYSSLTIVAYLISTSLHQYLYGIPPFYYFRRLDKYFPFFVFFFNLATVGATATIAKRSTFLGRQAIHAILVLSILINILVVWENKDVAWGIKNPESPIPITKELVRPKLGRIFTFTDNVSKSDYSFTVFNYATQYDLRDFAGYDTFIRKLNSKLTLGINYKAAYNKLPDKKMLDYLSSWSVRYLQTRNTLIGRNYFKQHSQLKPLYQDDKILLYENSKALPYVYDAANPKQAVPHEFGVNEVNIYPGNNQPRRLIVNIAPLSRYVVYLDGKKYGRVVPALGPIAVDVPAKVGHVMIRYEDPLFRLGVGLCLATWLSLTLIYLINKLVIPTKHNLSIMAEIF